MRSVLKEALQNIQTDRSAEILSTLWYLDEVTFVVKCAHIVKFLTYVRDEPNLQFKQLIDICGVDYPERADRFEVVYHLLSLKHNMRLRVKVTTDEQTPVPTVTNLFSAANWYEREVFDLYGVSFEGHPDLRRLLTDYNFQGYPMRKDFPLTGYVEPRYDAELQRVIYEAVQLPQEFRTFDFLSPWEGLTPQLDLHGDEKALKDRDD
jgi:NADH-quinone oxidoreductase subunit C